MSVYVLTPRTCKLVPTKICADEIKDLDMRSSWNNWVGPKSNDKCSYRIHKERHEEKREVCVRTEAEIGVIQT